MKLRGAIVIIGFSLLYFGACKKDETPEDALKVWLNLIDHGKYDEAQKLSSENGQYIVNVLKRINTQDDQEEHHFKTLNCRVVKDSAICSFTYEEGLKDSVYMKKVKGKWLYGGNYEQLDEGLDEFFDEIYEDSPDSSAL